MGRLPRCLVSASILAPYALLLLLSLGRGWSFPNLFPDRFDLQPWRHFASDRDGMLRALATSIGMSLVVGTLSTFGGLFVSRAVRKSGSMIWRFLIYLPFVVSPVVVGICLYDLLVRLDLAGRIVGVLLLQVLFSMAFGAVFFSELWSPRAERLELLVRNFGGRGWQVWRHGVLPPMSGLVVVCFLQTALYSWLDYGLISVVGGGHVPSVTMKLFAYIREASVNQAAQSSLVLLGPALAGFVATALVLSRKRFSGSDA